MTACILGADICEPVSATIQRYGMFERSDPLLIAFSGGADSTALASTLVDLGYSVTLAHVDHGLRAESAREADHCRRIARRLGVRILCRRVTVDPATQAEARRVRYAALSEMAKECGARRIATGHTRDDQAETVLLRLRRGGYGLGIPPIRQNVVRPLIEVSRSSTERSCHEAGLEFLNDPSNLNPRYRRVVVRSELAAAGAAEMSRVLAVGGEASRQAGRVAAQVDKAWAGLVEHDGDRLRICRRRLADLEAGVARQLFHTIGMQLGLELKNRLVDEIVSQAARTGRRLSLPAGFSVWWEPDSVVVGRWQTAGTLASHEVRVGSHARLPDWGIEVISTPVDIQTSPDSNPFSEVMDAGVLGSSFTVRQWRPGDRFWPLGAPGTKKLQDFFVDSKVPAVKRGTVPIVTAGDRILWVAGYRLDSSARITSRSTGAVRLGIVPLGEKWRVR